MFVRYVNSSSDVEFEFHFRVNEPFIYVNTEQST